MKRPLRLGSTVELSVVVEERGDEHEFTFVLTLPVPPARFVETLRAAAREGVTWRDDGADVSLRPVGFASRATR